ncbi:hypothetical protein BB934_43175 (plasmid) [Microvirga ossetica]|uniref:Uncharacterized protein n=1 Tax=Microvirga ossetica TaxID=1882682 RepID=A0A1B2EYH8_9HYPH|nr:hypothetical protein BB934_43175 [Microvirga ossetica]
MRHLLSLSHSFNSASALMVALRLAFVILSRRSVSVVSGGSSVERRNAHMRQEGAMLGAMNAVTVPAKSAAVTSPLKKRTVGAALRFDGFAAAIDEKLKPYVQSNRLLRGCFPCCTLLSHLSLVERRKGHLNAAWPGLPQVSGL